MIFLRNLTRRIWRLIFPTPPSDVGRVVRLTLDANFKVGDET